jgi:hypothetical protein
MNSKKLLAPWGLKWNPFSAELPHDGQLLTPKIDHFAGSTGRAAPEAQPAPTLMSFRVVLTAAAYDDLDRLMAWLEGLILG